MAAAASEMHAIDDLLIKRGSISQEQAKTNMQESTERYQNASKANKVAAVINNFHFILPGGYYRTEFGWPTTERGKQIQADLDALMESGQNTIASDPNDHSPHNLEQKAKIYLAMRAKGYSREELTR